MANISLRRDRHSVSCLNAHLICITKYRRGVFTDPGLRNIEESFNKVALAMGFEIQDFNGESNHVHCLLSYPPKLSLSQITNSLKGVSSRYYRKAGFKCPSEKHLWSPSYYVSSVGGAPLEVLKQYIADQARPEVH